MNAIPGMSGPISKPTASKPSTSIPSTAPKSDPRAIDRPAMPTTAEGRKKEIERLKAKGITRAKDNAAAKKSPAAGAAITPAQKALPSTGGAPPKPSGMAVADVPEEVRHSRRMAKKGKKTVRT